MQAFHPIVARQACASVAIFCISVDAFGRFVPFSGGRPVPGSRVQSRAILGEMAVNRGGTTAPRLLLMHLEQKSGKDIRNQW